MPEQAPQQKSIGFTAPPVATVGNTLVSVLGEAPFAGTVSAVTFTPAADITGAATHNRTFSLINKGQDGNGTTVIASLNMASGINAADFDEKAITLSVVAAATTVAAGDILAWSSAAVGTGIADPGGRVEVTIDLA